MTEQDKKSNSQNWELEVVCKSSEYLKAVVTSLLHLNVIDFSVELTGINRNYDDDFCGRYTVFIKCSWFHNLASVAKNLNKIEKKFEK